MTVSDFDWSESGRLPGRPAATIHLFIAVAGARDHEAILWLEEETGVPLRRRQTTNAPTARCSSTSAIDNLT